MPANSSVLSLFPFHVESQVISAFIFLLSHWDGMSWILLFSLFPVWLLNWMLRVIPLEVCLFFRACCCGLQEGGLLRSGDGRVLEPVCSAVGTVYPQLPCVWTSCFFTHCGCGCSGIPESDPDSRLTTCSPWLLRLFPSELTCGRNAALSRPVALLPRPSS